MTKKRRISVADNWCPCYPDGTVELSLKLYAPGINEEECYVKITAFGMDDFGVEMEYVTDDFSDALDRFKFWDEWIFSKVPDGITVEWFYEHGFVNF